MDIQIWTTKILLILLILSNKKKNLVKPCRNQIA